jgi:hypothetical protein
MGATRMGIAALAAGVFAGLAAAAPAGAASIAVNAACFLDSDTITVSGSGFTPGAAVNYAFNGVTQTSGTADNAGNVAQQVPAPVLPIDSVVSTYNLTATDQSNLGNVGSAQVTITKLTASLSPQKARPRRKIKFNVRGMPPAVTVFLHYVFHGRSRATITLGRPNAPCGTMTKRRRFFPFDHPSIGIWTFQFDNNRRYSPNSRPAIRGKVQIYRSFRSSAVAPILN